MVAMNKKDIGSITLIVAPVLIFTILLASIQPVYVNGINFRANLNQSITENQLADMASILKENDWDVEYPAPAPYSYQTGGSATVVLIKSGQSEIWLIAGDESYFLGEWSYKFDILRGYGNDMQQQKAVINTVLENVSRLISLNYSSEKLSIDDNDFVMMPYDIERILYAFCIGITLSGTLLFYVHKSDMWWLLLKNQKVLDSFILLTVGFFPTWFLIQALRGYLTMRPLCNTMLLIFFGLLILGLFNLKHTKEVKKNEK